MTQAGGPEVERVATVRSLDLLDTPAEERFDRIVDLARRIFDVPYAAVNLIDADRQWSKAASGLPFAQELPLSRSFCATTVTDEGALVVPDARADARFRDNPATVEDPGVRFYAGQPLAVDGARVGALCLVDQQPRQLTDDQLELLEELGRWAESELTRSADMRQAAEVQRRLLPSTAPEVVGLDVAGRCVQSRGVGGDFYDWMDADGQLNVVLADVMGKGLSAAIQAAGVRATLRTTMRFNTMETALRKSSRSIAEDLDGAGAFVTAFLARVDGRDGQVEYVDAGHGLGFVLEAEGAFRRLKDTQPPLGIDPDHPWHSRRTVLGPGDALVAVSDGYLDFITSEAEARAALEELGRESVSAEQIAENFISWAVDRVPLDDVSVLVVRRAA
ncbi:PP2C family protein-serine/threonine phosphatase [Georgenia satyanarayanai]|uniref:PP2C family protein-serine/threonine phosphatase n=1 Tax=Georgenia satyanarayanai TaxID=860221 RepID=UPI0012648A39|nr:SpoIIE family protein phosphatase [Georgenia satyanarayanai]